ncbi:MAG: hypothetical protein AB7U20_10235 [Planctomycetaceae bacterium]
MTHSWWLRAIGGFLAAESPLRKADAAVVLGGDHRLQRAAEFWKDGTVSEIWLLEREPSYAVSAGILPPAHAVEVEELKSLGVPDARIRVLQGALRDVDDAARIISGEVRRSPDQRLLVLCHRPQCRNLRLVLDLVLGRSSGSQVGVRGVPADAFHEGNWWKSRTGWKDTFNATCELLFTMLHGVDVKRTQTPWNPDDFERQFVLKYEGSGCPGSE